jgi:syntaxin 5
VLSPRKSILSSESKPQSSTSTESSNGDVVIDVPSSSQLQIYANDNIVASREEAVLNIERMMGELQGIFQQLASLVSQQGELIERIDNDVSLSLTNVNGAREQIAKYLKSISSNRWLMIKIFAILFVFIIVFLALFI